MKSLSLVMHCYNEEKSLRKLVERAIACAQRRNIEPKYFKLVLVENGSKDNSLQLMETLSKEFEGYIEIVPVSPNLGYGNGIFQGLKATDSDYLAWTHADEQCDPEDVFLAWEKAENEKENVLIKGKRRGRAFSEKVISRGFEILASIILFSKFHEINAQPKVFRKDLLSELTNPPKDFAFDLYVLVKAKEKKYTIKEFTVDFPPRSYGESNWASSFSSRLRTILKMLRYMIDYRLGNIPK